MEIKNIINLIGSTVKGIWVTKREREQYAYAYAFGFVYSMLTPEQKEQVLRHAQGKALDKITESH